MNWVYPYKLYYNGKPQAYAHSSMINLPLEITGVFSYVI